MTNLKETIEAAWDERSLTKDPVTQKAIHATIEEFDKGRLRVAQQNHAGEWVVNDWVKKAVVLYFPICQMETIEVGPFEFTTKFRSSADTKNWVCG